jgi:hypothetical protein
MFPGQPFLGYHVVHVVKDLPSGNGAIQDGLQASCLIATKCVLSRFFVLYLLQHII